MCRKAADVAAQFPADRHYIEKRVAFVDAANALKNSGDLVNALVYATKAVDVANLGHDLDFGRSEAYATRGSIEFYLGALSSADKDLGLSEDYERKAIAWAEKQAPINIPDYKKVLGEELRFHANVSLHMNHAEAAKRELAEALSL